MAPNGAVAALQWSAALAGLASHSIACRDCRDTWLLSIYITKQLAGSISEAELRQAWAIVCRG